MVTRLVSKGNGLVSSWKAAAEEFWRRLSLVGIGPPFNAKVLCGAFCSVKLVGIGMPLSSSQVGMLAEDPWRRFKVVGMYWGKEVMMKFRLLRIMRCFFFASRGEESADSERPERFVFWLLDMNGTGINWKHGFISREVCVWFRLTVKRIKIYVNSKTSKSSCTVQFSKVTG